MKSPLHENLRQVAAMLAGLERFEPQIEQAANLITTALLGGKKLLACGNGGSAADASHLTTEFVCRYDRDRRPYPAISFTANGGDLTAIGNDYRFEELFARQVRAYGSAGDVLVVFTTSGKSENVRRAIVAANEIGVPVIALLGRNGGACRGLAAVEFVVEHSVTARIQEAHKILLHTLCETVEQTLAPIPNDDPG